MRPASSRFAFGTRREASAASRPLPADIPDRDARSSAPPSPPKLAAERRSAPAQAKPGRELQTLGLVCSWTRDDRLVLAGVQGLRVSDGFEIALIRRIKKARPDRANRASRSMNRLG